MRCVSGGAWTGEQTERSVERADVRFGEIKLKLDGKPTRKFSANADMAIHGNCDAGLSCFCVQLCDSQRLSLFDRCAAETDWKIVKSCKKTCNLIIKDIFIRRFVKRFKRCTCLSHIVFYPFIWTLLQLLIFSWLVTGRCLYSWRKQALMQGNRQTKACDCDNAVAVKVSTGVSADASQNKHGFREHQYSKQSHIGKLYNPQQCRKNKKRGSVVVILVIGINYKAAKDISNTQS